MKGLILCAGYGTRLGDLTKDTPKCMIKIDGKPVLEHLVEYMQGYGVGPIVVNTHHEPIKIMEHFGPRLLYTYEPELLGEEGTIQSLSRFLANDFTLVMNGDTLTNLDLNTMFKMSKGRNVRFMDGKVYAGTKIISPMYFHGNKKFVDYYSSKEYWIDMGTPEGLAKARKKYEKANVS